jgi:hypothetical protein
VGACPIPSPAENNGPMMFARTGMMQAINRHRVKEFDSSHNRTIGEKNLSGTNKIFTF